MGRATGELTLWNTTQNPHIVRFIGSLVTGVPEDKLRVVAPEVGGGFGSKIAQYPGDFITVLLRDEAGPAGEVDRDAAARTTSPTTHGRDHVQEVELAARGGQDHRPARARCGPAWARISRPPRREFRPSSTA